MSSIYFSFLGVKLILMVFFFGLFLHVEGVCISLNVQFENLFAQNTINALLAFLLLSMTASNLAW